jgi:hypothetical protein
MAFFKDKLLFLLEILKTDFSVNPAGPWFEPRLGSHDLKTRLQLVLLAKTQLPKL